MSNEREFSLHFLRLFQAQVLRFPDIAYFRDPDVQTHLANILYLWSSVNTDIGYRQGMHELLAMLYIAVDFDSVEEDGVSDQTLGSLCARTWVAADAWALFVSLMSKMGKWYAAHVYFVVYRSSFGSGTNGENHLPRQQGNRISPLMFTYHWKMDKSMRLHMLLQLYSPATGCNRSTSSPLIRNCGRASRRPG
jgi:hypothetical protein